jgi:phosphoenolpyruvate phosphomutase
MTFPLRNPDPAATRRELRRLIDAPEVLVVPGPYDAVSARLLVDMGFKALWAGGFVSTATAMGTPDIGLIGMAEHLAFCRNMADATGVPIIADVDTGYGNAVAVTRTVQAFDRGGIAAIVMEDQKTPKQSSLYPGDRRLLPVAEMVGKIKAAVDSRFDSNLMVWARTDSFAAGVDCSEALERAHAYAEAGADVIVPVGRERESVAAFARAWDGAKPICTIPTFFPEQTTEEIRQLGWAAQVVSLTPILAALNAVEQIMRPLLDNGAIDYPGQMTQFRKLVALMGQEQFLELERTYLPPPDRV